MSEGRPIEPTIPIEPDPSSGSYETVGPAGRSGTGARRTIIGGVAAAVVALLGGGAYAAYSFLGGGGPQPDQVLPAATVAVVSVDLDPSAAQKIAAITSMRKFPALKKSLGLHADDDLRKYVFDKAVVSGGHCSGLDFDKDVKPWLGKRAAFAAVDLGGRDPVPALAIQVSDAGKAKRGFDAIVRCTHPEKFAFVVGDNYLIASDTPTHAKTIMDLGATKPLADDPAYRKWTAAAGDPGVLNFYVARRAADYLDRIMGDFSTPSGPFTQSSSSSSVGSSAPATAPRPTTPFTDLAKGFQGLAGTVRFAGGGMELALATGGLDRYNGIAPVGGDVGNLPADTTAAFGLGIPDGFANAIVDGLAGTPGDAVAQAERQTGLDLPGDLQTLLGKAVTVSLGGAAPPSADDVHKPADVPAGLVIRGDPDGIKAVIAKIEDHTGFSLAKVPLVLDTSGDKVAIATSQDYATTLLGSGRLGADRRFTDAVPSSGKASQILYVDFDSPWRDVVTGLVRKGAGSTAAGEFDANTRPLRSLGISTWRDGDVTHQVVKLTTD